MYSTWKLIPAVVILAATAVALLARPPREPVPERELASLVISVAVLYAVGGIAVLVHRTILAAIVFGVGLMICALALWLSRGDAPPPPRDDDGGPPVDPAPEPPRDVDWGPEPPTDFDWGFYEDQFRESAPH